MNTIFEKVLVLVLISISFILLVLSNILYMINKKKGVFAFIISLIFTGINCYYLYLTFYASPFHSSILKREISLQELKVEKIETSLQPKKEEKVRTEKVPQEESEIYVYIEVNGETIKVKNGDEIEMHKNTRFKISRVETKIPVRNIKANFIGFVPPGKNTANDIGYWISYSKLIKRKAIDINKSKFELVIKGDGKIIGKVYFKFI